MTGTERLGPLTEREAFVEDVIRPMGVSENVVAAFASVDRAPFIIDPAQKKIAYSDGIVRLSHDGLSTISQPTLVALMIDQLRLTGTERTLEVGTATGYQAALLSKLSAEVHTIEVDNMLARIAEGTLKEQGYENVHVHRGDGAVGFQDEGPYDAIILTAGIREVPPKLVEQLKVNGRLVAPVGEVPHDARFMSYYKEIDGRLHGEDHGQCAFVPLFSREPGGWTDWELKAARREWLKRKFGEEDFNRAKLREHLIEIAGREEYESFVGQMAGSLSSIFRTKVTEAQVLGVLELFPKIEDGDDTEANEETDTDGPEPPHLDPYS